MSRAEHESSMTTTWKRIRKVDGGFIFSRYTPWSLGVAKTPSHPFTPRKTPISQRLPTTLSDTPSSSAVNGARIRRKPPLPSHRLLSIAETHTPRLTFCNQKQLPPPSPTGGLDAFTSPTPKKFPDLWGVFTGRTPIFGRYRVGSGGIIRLADDVFGGGSADLRCGSVDFLVPYTIL